jgi:spore germination protein GerM
MFYFNRRFFESIIQRGYEYSLFLNIIGVIKNIYYNIDNMITNEQISKLEDANKIINGFTEEAKNLIKIYNSIAREARRRFVKKVTDSRNDLTNTSFITPSYRNGKKELEIRRESIEKMISVYDIDSELEFNSLKFERFNKETTEFEFSYWEERTIYSC